MRNNLDSLHLDDLDDSEEQFGRSRSRRDTRARPTEDDLDIPVKRNRKQRPPRTERDQAFKCGHCKQFIGAPISGGRQRNHCPNCLHSKHVDKKMPGDRRSDCGSLMEPIGIISRRNGEEQIVHRCLGCGKEQPNRIAADDNPAALELLHPLESQFEHDDEGEFDELTAFIPATLLVPEDERT